MIGPLLVELMEKTAGLGASAEHFGAPKVPTPKISMPKPPKSIPLSVPGVPTIKKAELGGYEEAGVSFPEHEHRPWRAHNHHARLIPLARSGPKGALAALMGAAVLSQPKTAAVRTVFSFLSALEE